MNKNIFGLALLTLAIVLIGLFLRGQKETKTETAAAHFECSGTLYSGAWFDVTVPAGFVPEPSLPSSGNDGFDSVWFINSDLDLALYIYSPQWGGMPSDVFDDPAINTFEERRQDSEESSVLTRAINYHDGQFGKFTLTNMKSYQSHLTTGYKSQHSTLPAELEQIYNCFTDSIQQFAD